MWPYMYEPRSKIYDYDYDNEVEEQGSCLSDIWLIPMLPVMFVAMVFVSLAPMIAMFVYYLSDVYKTTKKTLETGEISYPFLAQVGVFVFLYLLGVFLHPASKNGISLSPTRIIAIVFIFNHTFLPYSVLLINKFKSLFRTENA